MPRNPITVTGVSKPVGPFAVVVEGTPTMFLSGQVAQEPKSGTIVGEDAETQARQVFTNIMKIIESAGKSETDILRVALYLTDMTDFTVVNGVYAEFFSEPYPVRTAISVAGLPLGALIEADVILG